jgi:hypothetical protein
MELDNEAEVASAEPTGGLVSCSAEFSELLTEFSKLFTDHQQPKGEAARFAMALGIYHNRRHRRNEWKKPQGTKITNIAHWGPFCFGYDLETLFQVLGIADPDVPINLVVSEYITGGLSWIDENSLHDGKNFSEMKAQMSDLF